MGEFLNLARMYQILFQQGVVSRSTIASKVDLDYEEERRLLDEEAANLPVPPQMEKEDEDDDNGDADPMDEDEDGQNDRDD